MEEIQRLYYPMGIVNSLESKNDYWFRYCLLNYPHEIETVITEKDINLAQNIIHLDIYGNDLPHPQWNLIFIHGTSVYSRFYADFLYLLYKEGIRIIAMDLPGHGRSGGLRGHFTMDLFTQTLFELTSYVKEHYPGNVGIMGSSLGGITTLYCAANDPRVQAAICHNAAIFNENAHKRIVKIRGPIKLIYPLVPFLAKIFPLLKISVWTYLDPTNLVKTTTGKEIMLQLMKDPKLSAYYTLTALSTQMQAPLANPVEKIEVPILIMGSDNDILFSIDYMQEIFQRLHKSPHKELAIIQNASHMILIENQKESIQKITNWLDLLTKP
jgi:alpha-beta hydrolase superfamily lysophospholipase